jgi:methylmalonyl-CoA mutase
MSSETELRLAADFEPATRDAWRKLALGVLTKSGALDAEDPEALDKVEDALEKPTYDGFDIEALYTASDEAPQGVRTSGYRAEPGPWDVRQRHDDPDAKATNHAILTDLDNGVSSVWLGSGVAVGDIAAALDGVLLDLAPVVLDAGAKSAAAADALLAIARTKGVTTALRGSLGFDPVGLAARTGTSVDFAATADYAGRLADFPQLALVTIDGTVFHDAGGSDAQELGLALASAVATARALVDAGLSNDEALSRIELRLAATADQFLTIAKVRAARRAWARIADVAGASNKAVRIHAVSSSAMISSRDPWVNMLRVTLACFGAGVGGADAVTVQPFDAGIGLPDAFARRIARNTHALLQLESNVAKVADPAGGSWYVEQLTDELALAAWDVFTATEASGGIVKALEAGEVRKQLDETWTARSVEIAHRRDPITGVSEFPNLDERLPERKTAPQVSHQGLPRRRYSESFEALRTRADVHAASTGTRPTVFLATLGSIATHTGRATFASNLLAAGGIASVTAGATSTDDVDALAAQVAEAFTKSGASVACLCSTDKVYAGVASAVAAKLTEAGARAIWLAGPIKDYVGVSHFLYSGCDAIDVLTQALEQLGVA